jgi:uncharacterized alkaline shock family protein YloU
VIELVRTSLGRIAVDEQALNRLLRDATERIDGVDSVHGRRGVRVAVEAEGDVEVTIGIVSVHGVVLPELGRRVQDRLCDVLRAALEPRSLRIDVAIEEVA